MSPADNTPAFVLFDLMKRQCGIAHKEVAGFVLSGKPLSDGRSPVSRKDDRTWVSRFIVHAPRGSLSDKYFCDFSTSALRLASRMKSRSKRPFTGQQILDLVCGDAGLAMDRALAAQGEDPAVYRNLLERIAADTSLYPDERAEIALVAFVAAGCTADPARAVREAQGFAVKIHGSAVATPPSCAEANAGLYIGASEESPVWMGLLRVSDGLVAGAPHWISPTGEKVEIGSLALAEGSVADVAPDVSGVHARIWRDGEGSWWVEGANSRNGTTLTSALTGEGTVVEPPKKQRDGFEPRPVKISLGDTLTLGSQTTFIAIEGFPG